MKKLTLTVVVWGLAASLCFARGTSQQQSGGLTLKPGVLSIGMEIGYPPMEYFDIDGKTPIGFDVQLAQALGAQLGLEVEFVDTAWDGIFAGVNTNKYDAIISSVTITEERLEAFNFTKPYIGNAMVIVVSRKAALPVTKPEDIAGYRVTYQAETTADIYATRLAQQGVGFTAFEYDKVMNCFDEIKLGRVDIIIVDSLVAFEYLSRDPDLYIAWQGKADETFGICLKKGNDALTSALNGALDALFADGTLAGISQDIFKMDLVSSVKQ
ncbi:MAG: ABC transporter substrate-binding protein [Spirochaetaceae bacterium]|jgi:polar amino acid transport system substrate-binding protein|nr:ABC transporter substrate-binding protein [Spirochaetaceae bacterium]